MKNLWIVVAFLISLAAKGQNGNEILKKLEIRIDTNVYVYPADAIYYKGEKTLFFGASGAREFAEITLHPSEEFQVNELNLLPSEDYTIVDSIRKISNKFFRGKVRFNRLTEIAFIRLRVGLSTDQHKNWTEEFKLSPSFVPEVNIPSEEIELYMGEERLIEIPAKNAFTISPSQNYQTIGGLRFKTDVDFDKIKLLVQPEQAGDKELTLSLKTDRPYLSSKGILTNEVRPFKIRFSTRPGRLHFVNFDKNEFFLDPGMANAEEVQIEYNRGFELNKTYRIENQQKPGGRLIGELFTVSVVGNNKILAWFRPYTLHRISEGYLFIKDGDEAKFITNVNILQRPAIQQISILREGQDWNSNLTVYPGEKTEVKIEGKGLSKAEFQFEGINHQQLDTSRASDDVQFYRLKIPVDLSQKRISVYMNKTITRYDLQVREYQIPKELDFVSINYLAEPVVATSFIFDKPVLYRSTISDVNIIFNRNAIDSKSKIYGKQYLNFEIRIYNNRNDLIEFQKIENVVICPGESSPRYSFYDPKECRNTNINLNDYLLHKTYDLDGWSRLEIKIGHNEQKYGYPGYSRKVVLIKERRAVVDLQISFPTGLLVKRFDQSGIGNLTGISTAFLAQMSFYDKQKAGKLKPYKVGAGFIALDVFNINDKQRDLGIIVLGSLIPLKKEARFTFPLYLGAGYLIKSNSIFTVFGPGVQFNF